MHTCFDAGPDKGAADAIEKVLGANWVPKGGNGH